jgi:hypothetical protein
LERVTFLTSLLIFTAKRNTFYFLFTIIFMRDDGADAGQLSRETRQCGKQGGRKGNIVFILAAKGTLSSSRFIFRFFRHFKILFSNFEKKKELPTCSLGYKNPLT